MQIKSKLTIKFSAKSTIARSNKPSPRANRSYELPSAAPMQDISASIPTNIRHPINPINNSPFVACERVISFWYFPLLHEKAKAACTKFSLNAASAFLQTLSASSHLRIRQ